MGAKQKGGSSKPRGNQAEEVEETLQAVVLADTFETRFEPFTLDRPRVRFVDAGGYYCVHSAGNNGLTRWVVIVSSSACEYAPH